MRGPSSGMKALAFRLNTNALSDEDKEKLAEVQQILALKKDGATILECARRLGKTERALQQYMQRGVYKLFVDYALKLERGDDDKQIGEIVRSARQAFAQFAPDAIDFYKECYRRNPVDEQPEKGIFVDPARAEWATERVSKGLGLTEPEVAVRPMIHIKSAIIVGELHAAALDDARARAAIDITPTDKDD